MLDIGSPPEHEETDRTSVLPSPGHHASRSSTPGISSLDGTPRYLYAPFHDAPPRPSSVPPDLDMTVKAAPLPDAERLDRHDWPSAGLIADEHVFFPPTMHQKHPSMEASPTRTAVPDEDRRPAVSLSELSQLLRLQRYQKRRARQAKDHVQYLQLAAARASRLGSAARSVQHTLAECIRSEDKSSFVNLLHAFQDACDHCFEPTSATLSDHEPGGPKDFEPTLSFLGALSSSSRISILEFLSKIRDSSNFLADQLVSLSHKELLNLLPNRSISGSSESVLGGHSGVRSRSSKPLGFAVDAQIDNLASFAYNSPLETLIFSTQALDCRSPREHSKATSLWATVCARLISEQKPGSEKIVPAVLDIWSSVVPWPGKGRLETWIQQTLRGGAFLLEHPSKQSFRARIEGRSDITADEELRAEQFYAESSRSLLLLLGEMTGPSVIPPGALGLCAALSESLDGSMRYQKLLPHFIVTRWLCSSFIAEAVLLPETYAMMTDYYVSEVSRQRILREVVTRAQKAVFDVAYSWSTGYSPSPETTQLVNAIMAKFQHGASSSSPSSSAYSEAAYVDQVDNFIVLSAKDVLVSLQALYPKRRPASVASDGDNMTPGLLSSSSSVSGFSLFRQSNDNETIFGSSEHLTSDIDTLKPIRVEADLFDSGLDRDHILEASLELEDLISNHSSVNGSLWDVLLSRPPTTGLILANSALGDTSQRISDMFPRIGSPENSTHLAACAKDVELLLRDYASACQLPTSCVYGTAPALETQTAITSLFDRSIDDCIAREDYLRAHEWHEHRLKFQEYLSFVSAPWAITDLLSHMEVVACSSIERTGNMHRVCEDWVQRLDTPAQLRKKHINQHLEGHERLRDKLWYIADLRTSAAFEEARLVAAALRIMGKAKKPLQTRMQPPLRHYNGSRLSESGKTEAQILEILSAKPEHGGTNKLSDDVSRITELWMGRENIDNICTGEERLHKLCMEVRKCVDSIMAAPIESTIIGTNSLFAQDEGLRLHTSVKSQMLLHEPLISTGQHSYLASTTQLRSNDALSSTSQTLSSMSSRDLFDIRSPALTNKSSVPFWSPVTTEIDSQSSATSVDLCQNQSTLEQSSRKPDSSIRTGGESKLGLLRQRAISLLLSDLTSILFSEGSETDRAFWTGLGWTLAERHLRSVNALQSEVEQGATSSFDFEAAFSNRLRKFSATSNPHTKLVCLSEIDRLLGSYMAKHSFTTCPISLSSPAANDGTNNSMGRIGDLEDMKVRGFRHIFSRNSLRPSTIFRDLQYIAALVPSNILHATPEGKAFCNAALAISLLKLEIRSIMVETADGIIAHHSNNRGHGKTSSTAQQQRDSATFTAPARTPSAEDVSRYDMKDAAYLYQIAAKEGDAAAQRELATLYMTHPELMDPIVAPFTRPRDVFKDELESKWRKNHDLNRCDPAIMCVALHWMSLSSKGGDSLAKGTLRQREEMESLGQQHL